MGFADDISSFDTLRVKRGASTARVQSPWLDRGIAVVGQRVTDWMTRYREAGGKLDAFQVEVPPILRGSRLADLTIPAFDAISGDSRSRQLGSIVGIANFSDPRARSANILRWRSAARLLADIALGAAVDASVRSVFPEATPPVRLKAPVVGTGALGLSGLGTSPVGTKASEPPAPQASGSPQATPTTSGDVRWSAACESASQAARSAVAGLGGARISGEWSGPIRYRQPRTWAEIFDQARNSPSLRSCLFAVVEAGKQVVSCSRGLYVRPNALGEIDPSILDAGAARLQDPIVRERYALAMVDCSQAHFLRTKAMQLAIAAAYTNDQQMISKCNEILAAFADHRPLQRSGWGGEGVWLATNWGIIGITEMLAVLGDRVPADLQDRLRSLLYSEVVEITSDWSAKRPWFVLSKAYGSNQWIEPSAGLVLACLFLQDDRLRDAYDLGVENLARTLNALGSDGGFPEGLTYASMTVGALFDVIGSVAAAGDTRLAQSGFVRNSWKWFLHMHMPGRQYVNSYDSRMSQVPAWATSTPLPSHVAAALGSGEPDAIRVMSWFFPEGSASVSGIRYQAAVSGVHSGRAAPLPTFAVFPSQQQVVWRSRWERVTEPQTAMGIWVRGGSRSDSSAHVQRDQGQVSIYNGSEPVLIDCGTPDYQTEGYAVRAAGAPGHGIVQIGDPRPRGEPVDAPISIRQISEGGGDITVDCVSAYRSLERCIRGVRWDTSGSVTIVDEIVAQSAVDADTEVCRFHTGCNVPLQVSQGQGNSWVIAWPAATVTISANRPISVSQCPWEDALRNPFSHQVILVRAADRWRDVEVTTSIQLSGSER